MGLSVAPTVMTGVMSLYRWSLLGQPTFIGFENYRRVAGDATFWDSFRFTALYTAIVTVSLLIIGMGLGLVARRPGRSSSLLRTVAVVPVVIGFATASYVALWLLDTRIGLVDRILLDLHVIDQPISWFGSPGTALAAVSMFVVWKTVGLTMLLLLSGLQAISQDLYEAAAIDGAGTIRKFRSITLPLLRPTITLVTVLTVIASVLAFDQFFILTRGGPDGSTTTVVFSIYRSAFVDFDLGYAAAQSITLLVLLLILSTVQLGLLRTKDSR